jgi:hypothetical protein
LLHGAQLELLLPMPVLPNPPRLIDDGDEDDELPTDGDENDR